MALKDITNGLECEKQIIALMKLIEEDLWLKCEAIRRDKLLPLRSMCRGSETVKPAQKTANFFREFKPLVEEPEPIKPKAPSAYPAPSDKKKNPPRRRGSWTLDRQETLKSQAVRAAHDSFYSCMKAELAK